MALPFFCKVKLINAKQKPFFIIVLKKNEGVIKMFVQPIAMINCRKPHFTAAPERNNNGRWLQSYVTIQDLYDSEDRIMEHQQKLIDEQNILIANTLNTMAEYVVSAPNESANSRFGLALNKLIYSGSNRQQSDRVIIKV